MRKSIIKMFMLLFIVTVCLIPFNTKAVMTSLDISGNQQVYVNQTVNLKVTFNMSNDLYNENQEDENVSQNNIEDVTDKAVWISSNENIATINDEGVVTGIKPGSVTISANYNDIEATYDMIVVDNNENNSVDSNYDILTILTAVICPSIAIGASLAIIVLERKNAKNGSSK